MEASRTRILVETALTIALSVVLGLAVRPFRMPAGGSASLEMLPIVVLALRRGVAPGMVAGGLYGVLNYYVDPFFVHWSQVALDYPVAHGLVGLAGLLRQPWRRSLAAGRAVAAGWYVVLPAVVVGATGRLLAAGLSGVVFFASSTPIGQSVWIYSLGYNATYLVPSAIACGVAAAILMPILERAVPAS